MRHFLRQQHVVFPHKRGFVAQLGLSLDLPLAQTDSAYGDGTRYGKCCESI